MGPLKELTRRLAVVVCTHNPRPAHLRAALDGLRLQRLDPACWELVVVDNASVPALDGQLDLGWHPAGRVVREEKLGLTRARLRGIAETSAPLLVFVDDDNALEPDYLERAVELADAHPALGIWSGRVDLEFETPPPEWTRKYWTFLAHRPLESDALGQGVNLDEPLPVGAGLCIRREAAAAYAEAVRGSGLRMSLDRRGTELSSAGDTDMVMTTSAQGWQRGVFSRLRLRHLIPPGRLEEHYLARLVGEVHYSSLVARMLNEPRFVPEPVGVWWWLKCACDLSIKFGRKRRFFQAAKTAHRRARALYEASMRSRVGPGPATSPFTSLRGLPAVDPPR